MIENAIKISERIEKGFVYLKSANEKDYEKFKPALEKLIEEYEEIIKKETNEDIKALLTRIFILSVKG